MARVNKATRPFFCASKRGDGCAYLEDEVDFDWHSGMSWQVRQRSSDAMHRAILEKFPQIGLEPSEILEVSTASHDYEVGQALSALNLIYTDPDSHESHPLENWFQSSKVFVKNGKEWGPYRELLDIKHAKRYINPNPDNRTVAQFKDAPLFERTLFKRIQDEIRGSMMSCFKLFGEEYPLVPKSAFYDYLYVSALCQPQNRELADKLMDFRVFTDIMFNPGAGKTKRYNTQARSCAIYVALARRHALDAGVPAFKDFVEAVDYPPDTQQPQQPKQSNIFDEL